MDQTNTTLIEDLLSPQLSWMFQQPQRLGKPSGWWGHVPFAFWLIAALRPRLLVELGSHHGVSYAAFCEAVSRERLACRCYAVDNWQGDAHAGYFNEEVYRDLLELNQARYSSFSELIRANFSDTVNHFADGSIDLLHIDGFHSYAAVSRDFQQWRPKLSKRAVVLFHDTNVRRDDFGVHRLFGELADQYDHFEFLHCNGLGLIAYGDQVPEVIQQLCAENVSHKGSTMRERFSSLGGRWESHANEHIMANSFAEQVNKLEQERVRAINQQAVAEQRAAELASQLQTVAELTKKHEVLRHDSARLDNHKLQTLQQQYSQTLQDNEELSSALKTAEAHGVQISEAFTSSQANTEILVSRMVNELLTRHKPPAPPGTLRRLRLMLRRGHAQRNPVADLVRRSPLFDTQWYLGAYPDVAMAGIDPAFHYLAHGAVEGRDPGPWFSTGNYLRHNPDVAGAGVNALFHYEVHGRTEGRCFPLKSIFQAVQPTASQMLETWQETDPKTAFRQDSLRQMHAFLDSGKSLQLPTTKQPLLSIIIILHNQAQLTFRCLQSLTEAIDVPAEVLIVDNASSDLTVTLLNRLQGCRILQQQDNLHFLRAANLASEKACGQYLLFLNNDTLVKPGSISAALAVFQQRPDTGAVGGKIILLDGSLQEAGSIIWSDGSCQGYGRGRDPQDKEFQFRREVDYCSGAFLMLPRRLFEQVGRFDQAFEPAYYEESDLCMRLRQAGHPVIYEPSVEIMHVEYGSDNGSQAAVQLMQKNHKTFVNHHAEVLANTHPASGSSLLQARMRKSLHGRILVIDDQLPIPSWGSGYPRASELLLALHDQGAFISHYATATSGIDLAEAYAILPREIEIIAAQGLAGLGTFLRSRKNYYDALIISRPHNMAALRAALDDDSELLGRTRLIYDAEAIFAQREVIKDRVLERQSTTTAASELDKELGLAAPAQTILTVNQAEAAHFTHAGYKDVRVLGHSFPVQPTASSFTERQDLLFVGRLTEDDSPNSDSIRWFVHEVMPRLDRLLGNTYRLDVVGACSATLRRSLESKRVCFHGRVEDIRPFYARSRLFIAPTRFSAGIPLKIFEAAGNGLPVVANRLLAEQLDWSEGIQLLAADTADSFAAACARLYSDPVLWLHLRQQALLSVTRDCSPQVFADSVWQLLQDALPHGKSNPGLDYLGKVSTHWSQPPLERRETQGLNWLEHPQVISRLNRKVSGNPDLRCYQQLRQFLEQRGWHFPVKRAASLGCGFGGLERALANEHMAERIDGYDIASGAIAEARRLGVQMHLPSLHYHVTDLERLQLPEAEFDLIFAYSCIHHIDDLDRMFKQIRQALRPGGIFHLHEYVGPDRFQWTDMQLEKINAFLESLPGHYNHTPAGVFRGPRERPSVDEVIAADPSEAIRSSEIADTLARHFRILQKQELGGALLHIGLSGIAQNFDPQSATDAALLESFFMQEDQLMAADLINSDFTIFTAIKD
ncbi:Glycosyltransferase, GT2 family [Pseudomonas pohangensis]|uniref:Glycosyltransferase, GT2 family n=1 Tax=Pseudomonas pohangensis TaxID=364197 RepID=A0A1H2EF18_9PSED|nr:class I SAM-dependent methyltransferase [Pseudomonas pohangensis]SDT93735.1 Glycosyltransferase, GT2 family [Pseudomonas pohangensis]